MNRSTLAAPAALLMLAACQVTPPPSLDREAGLPQPTFGLAVRNNEIVARGGAPIVGLQSRFAAEVPSVVTFEFDSAALDPLAAGALDRQAAWMRQFPELGFRVYGYADAPGPTPYNEALGRRRAETVVAYLAARGVDRGRLQALVSYGERAPAVATGGRERLNRRVVTQVFGFLSRHPTVLDGRYAEVVYREYVESAQPSAGVESEALQE